MSKPSATINRITWSVSFEEGVRMSRLQEVHDQFVSVDLTEMINGLAADFDQFNKFRAEIYASMRVNYQLDPTDQSCKVMRPFGFNDFAATKL
jgi:hypothetical protein